MRYLCIILLLLPANVFAGTLANGLFGYWNMDGNFQDVSGNNRHGVAVGSNVNTTTVESQNGESAVFGGSTVIDIGNQWPGGNTSITMASWVKTNRVGSGTGGGLGFGTVGVGNTSNLGHFYLRSVGVANSFLTGVNDNQPHIHIGVDDGSADRWHASQLDVLADVWYHVVTSYNAATREVKMYVDGSLSQGGVFQLSQNLNLGTEIRIGGDSYNDNFMEGMVDDVAIWDRVLGDQEVGQLFTQNGVVLGAIPEPSSLLLLLVGLIGFGYRRLCGRSLSSLFS